MKKTIITVSLLVLSFAARAEQCICVQPFERPEDSYWSDLQVVVNCPLGRDFRCEHYLGGNLLTARCVDVETGFSNQNSGTGDGNPRWMGTSCRLQ